MNDISRIDLNLLKVFHLIMTEGSVSRAATRLNLSQSTVSHALSRLRQQFRDELFVPVPGGMAPTVQATQMAPFIRQAMLLMEQSLCSAAPFDPATSTITYRLAGGDYVELILLPKLMRALRQQALNIIVEIRGLKDSDYLTELESLETDLVIGFAETGHLARSLKSQIIMPERLVLVSAEPLRSQNIIEQLDKLDFIYPSSWGHTQTVMDNWCTQHGINRRIALRTSGFIALPSLLRQSLVAVLPEAVAKHYQQQYQFHWYSLDDSLAYRHLMAWHPLRDKDPSLLWLRGLIESEAAQVLK